MPEFFRQLVTDWQAPTVTKLVIVALLTYGGTWVTQVREAVRSWTVELGSGDPYAEAAKHFSEWDEATCQIFRETGFGPVKVCHFPSDDCLYLEARGRYGRWVPAADFTAAEGARAEPVPLPILAGFAAVPQGRCLDPHPPPFEAWWGEWSQDSQGRTVRALWRSFADGCEHFALHLNGDPNLPERNADGSHRVHWTRCVH